MILPASASDIPVRRAKVVSACFGDSIRESTSLPYRIPALAAISSGYCWGTDELPITECGCSINVDLISEAYGPDLDRISKFGSAFIAGSIVLPGNTMVATSRYADGCSVMNERAVVSAMNCARSIGPISGCLLKNPRPA